MDRQKVMLNGVLPPPKFKALLIFIALIIVAGSSSVDGSLCNGTAAVGSSTSNVGLISDCNVLLSIKDHFSADLNWSNSTDIQNWEGVSLSNDRVVELYLKDKDLTGSIPPQLGNLSSLQKLSLTTNYLRESVPPELGNLSSLQELDLSDNLLMGSIPPQLGNLSSLRELLLHTNHLSGNIPPELGKLSNLTILGLRMPCFSSRGECGLIGNIPPELGNLSALQKLYLGWNRISGNIPPELGNLSNLTVLDFYNNRDLSGEIPNEFEGLASLEHLDIKNTNITGCVPDFLQHITVRKSDDVAYCLVNGVCGSSLNICSAGNLSDVPDNSSHSLWNCMGLHGGNDASCSDEKSQITSSDGDGEVVTGAESGSSSGRSGSSSGGGSRRSSGGSSGGGSRRSSGGSTSENVNNSEIEEISFIVTTHTVPSIQVDEESEIEPVPVQGRERSEPEPEEVVEVEPNVFDKLQTWVLILLALMVVTVVVFTLVWSQGNKSGKNKRAK